MDDRWLVGETASLFYWLIASLTPRNPGDKLDPMIPTPLDALRPAHADARKHPPGTLRGHLDPCDSCGLEGHYYMVQDHIWEAVAYGADMLCLGCVEHQLGRALTADDFTDCPLNQVIIWALTRETAEKRCSCESA